MTIKDRLDNLTDEQKIYLLQIVENLRKMDEFAKDYPFKDEYFDDSDPFYNIDCSFCIEDELLDIWYDVDRLAKVTNIIFAIGVVEEAF